MAGCFCVGWRESRSDCLFRYIVIVNRVYPLFVIVGQPDDLDKKVNEKGEHE